MKLYAIRLQQGQDLKQAIEQFVNEQNITAGAIVSAVGSLDKARLRMAGAQPDRQDIREYEGVFEIVSLIGTVSTERTHLHMSISDSEGQVLGGHLKEGSKIHTTVELVIGGEEQLQFGAEVDPATGFEELSIREIDD